MADAFDPPTYLAARVASDEWLTVPPSDPDYLVARRWVRSMVEASVSDDPAPFLVYLSPDQQGAAVAVINDLIGTVEAERDRQCLREWVQEQHRRERLHPAIEPRRWAESANPSSRRRLETSQFDPALYHSVLALAGRRAGPSLLDRWWSYGWVKGFDLALLLPGVWTAAESPVQHLGQRRWVEMFTEAGWVHTCAPEASALDPSVRPTEALTLFRGAPSNKARGMSWTLDIEQARQFAERFPYKGQAHVYRAKVKPAAMLGIFLDDRQEQEVVADPRRLPKRLEIVE